MNDRGFFDTNVLVYVVGQEDERTALAEALVEDAPSPITYASEKSPELLQEDARIAAHPLRLTREQIQIVPVTDIFH